MVQFVLKKKKRKKSKFCNSFIITISWRFYQTDFPFPLWGKFLFIYFCSKSNCCVFRQNNVLRLHLNYKTVAYC